MRVLNCIMVLLHYPVDNSQLAYSPLPHFPFEQVVPTINQILYLFNLNKDWNYKKIVVVAKTNPFKQREQEYCHKIHSV